ncbi:hypothetical protein ACET3Z_025818 [Daucus carota]
MKERGGNRQKMAMDEEKKQIKNEDKNVEREDYKGAGKVENDDTNAKEESQQVRRIEGLVDENFKDVMQRSLVGFTEDVTWADILQEKLLLQGYTFISVKGISHKSFVLTFEEDVNTLDSSMSFLHDLFYSVRPVTHSDLVLPRLTWLELNGLPMSVWNLPYWSKIVGEYGYIIKTTRAPFINGMYGGFKICISTNIEHEVCDQVNVCVEGEEFRVIIKEVRIEETFVGKESTLEEGSQRKDFSSGKGSSFSDSASRNTDRSFADHYTKSGEQHDVFIDIWRTREGVSLSTQTLGPDERDSQILFPSTLSEESEGNELYSSDELDKFNIKEKFLSLNIGRKKGRPRKYEKVYSFYDKRQKKLSKKKDGCDSKKLAVADKVVKRMVSKKENRKILRRKKLQELEPTEENFPQVLVQEGDTATQILEVGEMMGLIPFQDRENTLIKIREHLGAN